MSNGKSGTATVAQHESAAPPAIKRMRAAMTAGVALVIALLGVFAYSLVDSQQQAREDVEQRFADVAQVSAALTVGIFEISQTATQQQAMTQLGDARVDPRRLEALARRGQAPYLEVYDARGRRIAATARAPRDTAPTPEVRYALRTGRSRLSNAIGIGPQAVAEWAIPFRTSSGRRVYLSAIPLKNLGGFLAGFLSRVPNFADARSEVVDARGVVLGGSDLKEPLGRPLGDRALLEAMRKAKRGSYDDGRYFASSPIAGSPWRVVIATNQDDLYASVNGSRRTVPWLLFAAFALAALVGLFLLRRAATAAAELQRKELSERHAVEINDNIIQGLALASYELERGERMAGSSQVAETLREAQRLVSELLGKGEVQPGQLRRETPARTDPPEKEGDRS
jgi:hypothetical protein